MRRWSYSILILALFAGFAPCSEPKPSGEQTKPSTDSTKSNVDKLIEQLGAPAFADREVAQRLLLQSGAEGLAKLELAQVTHTDAEVRERAAILTYALKRSVASAKYIAPRFVKLDYQDVPLATAIADLRAKTQLNLMLDPIRVVDHQRKITVTTDTVSAWEAVELFRQAAKLKEVFREELNTPNRHSNDLPFSGRRVSNFGPTVNSNETANAVPILFADGVSPMLPGDRRSAIRVMALPARFPLNRVTRGSGEVVFHLDIAPPQDLRWDEVSSVRIDRAEDESGRPVTTAQPTVPNLPSQMFNEVFFGGAIQMAWQVDGFSSMGVPSQPNPRVFPIKLKTNDRTLRSLRVISGTLVGTVILTNQEIVTVTDLAKSVGQTMTAPNDTKLSILKVGTTPDGRVTFRMRIEGPNPWRARNMFGGNPFANIEADGLLSGNLSKFHFTDAEGHKLMTPMIMNSSMMDDMVRRTAEYEVVFQKHMGHGPPTKLVVMGNKPITVEVPFHLQNVQLP